MPETEKPDTSANSRRKNGRRCILTNETEPTENLVRLVEGPDGTLVPDLAERLPGRGIWVSTNGSKLREAVENGQLHKAACRSLKAKLSKHAVQDDLADLIDRLLVRRVLDRLNLERRAGNLVTGFDKIKAAMTKATKGKAGIKPAVLVTASDSGDDGRKKIKAAVGDVPEVAVFDRDALSDALGLDNVVHGLLFESGGAEKFMADVSRLLSMRGLAPLTCEAQGNEE